MSSKLWDLQKPTNRLLIGDVGSGKTLVALLSFLTYLNSIEVVSRQDSKLLETLTLEFGLKNYFTAFLAPTEVLATQHYQQLEKLKQNLELEWLDVICLTNKNVFLNGERITKKKLQIYLDNSGKLACWVGTQALFFLDNFQPLMVVADEQHRFGVKQRQILAENTQLELAANFISMTATPIPRTLALTIYGDLQASYIKRIRNRQPILTSIVEMEKFEQECLEKLQQQLDLGRKVYVICPAIDNSEKEAGVGEELWDLPKAINWLENLLPKISIMSLHGKIKEKDQILQDFKEATGATILVSTTVIEVGIDVGMASVIIILNPERFGLSQLHQIRGRVGRNDFSDNYCWMVVDQKSRSFIPRLQYLCRSQDGFEIAQEDLRLRGQGDLSGTTQSGDLDSLLGLSIESYEEIRSIAEVVDLDNTSRDLPLLAEYLDLESKKVWTE